MLPEDQALAEQCRGKSAALSRAVGWIDANRETVRHEADGLIHDLRRSMRKVGRCERAAERKMCVGVFGPSQSGKSYLISALARGTDGRLLANFQGARKKDGSDIDFIVDINPQGGKESTGLVTRFTLSAPPSLSPDFPVYLRLLSEADLIRIIGNTYNVDFRIVAKPDPERVARLIGELRNATASGRSGLSADDVDDLQDYFQKLIRDQDTVGFLNRIFWPAARDLVPRLGSSDRARLFSFLWGELQSFTNLYRRFQGVLEKCGFSAEVFASLDALIPREKSIIDVNALKDLADVSRGQDDRLNIKTAQGAQVSVTRTDLTALTAELTVFMASKPDDLFEHTDLLDFPGYRARLVLPRATEEVLALPDTLELLFRRGKVDYLFHRYCEENELTSLLLCIGPGNMEAKDLPAVIHDWVATTHGPTHSERTGRPVSLFLVLTMFDRECEIKAGSETKEGYVNRWSSRIHASLLDEFGREPDSWPLRWDERGAFRNLFWIRNPNVRADNLFDYRDGVESKKGEQTLIGNLKRGYLENDLVRNHFAQPETAWDAVMTPGDGGIRYLKESLRPVCNPALKRGQVSANLAMEVNKSQQRLRPFYRSDDKAVMRAEKDKLAKQLAVRFAQCIQHQRFGELLGQFLVRDQDFFDLLFHQPDFQADDSAEDGRERLQVADQVRLVGDSVSSDAILGDLFGDDFDLGEVLPQEEGREEAPAIRDEAALRVSRLLEFWTQKLRQSAEDEDLQRFFMFTPLDFEKMVLELIIGMQRHQVDQELEKEFRSLSSFRSIKRDQLIWKQAGYAASVLNGYIGWLGLDPRKKGESGRRVRVGNREMLVFKPPPEVAGLPVLGEEQMPYATNYYKDWVAAFVNMVRENVEFEGGGLINVVENAKLLDIIQAIEGKSPNRG